MRSISTLVKKVLSTCLWCALIHSTIIGQAQAQAPAGTPAFPTCRKSDRDCDPWLQAANKANDAASLAQVNLQSVATGFVGDKADDEAFQAHLDFENARWEAKWANDADEAAKFDDDKAHDPNLSNAGRARWAAARDDERKAAKQHREKLGAYIHSFVAHMDGEQQLTGQVTGIRDNAAAANAAAEAAEDLYHKCMKLPLCPETDEVGTGNNPTGKGEKSGGGNTPIHYAQQSGSPRLPESPEDTEYVTANVPPDSDDYVTADVPPDSTIEVQQPGYAVIFSADVESIQPVTPGDVLYAGNVESMRFNDGTVLHINHLASRPEHTPVTPTERTPITATAGKTSQHSQDHPAPIVTDNATTLPSKVYANVRDANGNKIGEMPRYTGLKVSPNSTYKVATVDKTGAILDKAKGAGGISDGSPMPHFNQPIHKASKLGKLFSGARRTMRR